MKSKFVVAPKGIILNNDKILLVKRADGGTWEFAGGSVEVGETPEEALFREIKEETGLKVEIKEVLYVSTVNSKCENQIIIIAYKCLSYSQKVNLSIEHTNYLWADYKTMFQLLPMHIITDLILNNVLEKLLNINFFSDSLISHEKSSIIPEEDNLFGQFVGEWEFEWVDHKGTKQERHVIGEWIFRWILEGTAIQDVFICPSRGERLNNPQPDGEYGTTVRIYNPKKKAWDIFYGCSGEATLLEAKKENDSIVLNYINRENENRDMKWIFSDITENSFHWSNTVSQDGGVTWSIAGELFAVRR
jgi:mutator protein MutT